MSQRRLVLDQRPEALFDDLIHEVARCRICPRMCDSQRVLSRAAGAVGAPVMFVGEAPGRLGADGSGIPFHGDKAGHNFENLLERVGLDRYGVFITNAVLCNPRSPEGNNATPSKSEILACSGYLKRQIDIIDPAIVVTLGGVALAAAALIERHKLELGRDVRTGHGWYGRVLIPAYHPGQRAQVHRSFLNQISDFQFIFETVQRLGRARTSASGAASSSAAHVVDLITRLQPAVSYFALHKLFYLVEIQSIRASGERLTKAFFLRQKDGPYCTELHPAKLKRALPALEFSQAEGGLVISRRNQELFERFDNEATERYFRIVKETIEKYGGLDNARLKSIVYLTPPMKALLRAERTSKKSLYNAPIDFGVRQ